MKARFLVDRMHDPLTLERWQFAAVASGQVPRDALMLYLAVQAVGREGREADLDAIGKSLALDAQAMLAVLQAAGWVLQSKGGWRMQAPRVAGAVTLSQDEPAKAPASPVAASGPTTTRRRPKRKKTPGTPGADASGPTPSPPTAPVEEPPPAPEIVALTTWVDDLTRRLIEAYPHGVTETGLERPAPRQPIRNKLLVMMRPLEPQERDALAAQIIDGARLMAEAYGEDLEQRKWVPMLMTWVNQRRWESPPRAPRGGKSVADRNRDHIQRTSAERRIEGYAPRPPVDPAALEEARRRREQAVRDAHRVTAQREEAGHDA